ncbi:MAG: helix-turn-helix domain-containing protein [Aristaeellaceae bacterium]
MIRLLQENLMMLRQMHGISQEELAEKIGISRQAYAKWESGATVPDIEKCKRLADFYGVTMDSLLTTQRDERMGMLPPAPRGKNIWGSVTINERGQLVIPKAARERFGLTGGQRLIVLSDEEGIALIPAEWFEEKMKLAMAQALRMNPEG